MKFLKVSLILSLGLVLCSAKTLKNGEGKRLIKTSEASPGVWMTEEEVFSLIQNRTTFMDVTDFDYSDVDKSKAKINAVPTVLQFQTEVNELIPLTNLTRIMDFIRSFSGYHNRYYSTSTGRSSQRWLLAEVQNSVVNYAGVAVVREVDHGYLQRSIVARLEGTDPTLRSEVVVLGAHLDSVNRHGASLNAPGADDNGSGSVALLETLRIIAEKGTTFKRTVEFQWYAAEEIGLRGSQAIAEEYRRTSVNVVGMLNFDVISYHDGKDRIAVYTDFGDQDMMQFIRILVNEYLDYTWENNQCGYACSDHASWTANDFKAVMASEFTGHPQMHTVYDIIQNMNFVQLQEFIKLTIGYTLEFAEPIPESP